MITPPQNTPQGGGGSGTVSPGDASRSGSEDLERTARHLGEEARHIGQEARSQGREQLEGLRGAAAENLEKLAEGAQAAASTLERDDVGHLSEYVSDVATRMTRLSSSLRSKSGDEILHDVSQMARENPALFITGSVAIGFGLARFARASQKKAVQENSSQSRSDEDQTYTPSPQTGSRDYAATGGGAAAGRTGSTTANPVNPAASQTGPSADPQGGIH